jgi:hypothetical protein
MQPKILYVMVAIALSATDYPAPGLSDAFQDDGSKKQTYGT